MANGNGTNGTNGSNISIRNISMIIVSTGVLGVLASGMMQVANDARIAIRVAEQHGEELLMIRGELVSIRTEMLERTQSRYTSEDAERHEKYIDSRMDSLQQQLERYIESTK